jgi:hypothetical protein
MGQFLTGFDAKCKFIRIVSADAYQGGGLQGACEKNESL